MIRSGGYFFTLLYLLGRYFPTSMTGWLAEVSSLSGPLAFGFFALLLARGVHRTRNHFLYFVRLLLGALLLESLDLAASYWLGIHLPSRNALFTYASSLALLAGISMALGCYRDLVAQVQPASGRLDRKILFGLPVNPGNYRMAPLPGLVTGLLTAAMSILVTIYFNFYQGLYGQLFILLAFLAMGLEESGGPGLLGKSVFLNKKVWARTFIYLAGLSAVFCLMTCLGKDFKAAMPLTRLASLGAVPLSAFLPEGPKPGKWLTRLSYASLPLTMGLLILIAYFI